MRGLENFGKFFKPAKPEQKPNNSTAVIKNNAIINKVADRSIHSRINSKGRSIEEIINNDLPLMIKKYVEVRGLENDPNLGTITKWGGSFAEKAIRNDDYNTGAKNFDTIEKEIVFRALDDYCSQQKISIRKAA